MKLVRLFILLVMVALSGCGGTQPSTNSSPTVAQTPVAVPSPSTIAQVVPSPVLTRDATHLPTPQSPSKNVSLYYPGVFGDFTVPQPSPTLSNTIIIGFPLVSSLEGGITATVTITFTAEGVLDSITPAHVTMVETPGTTLITTTVGLREEGQGIIYAEVAVLTYANTPNHIPCARTYGYGHSLDILATAIGLFPNQNTVSIDNYTAYLDTAKTRSVISEAEYDRRSQILITMDRGLIIELNGVEQEIHHLAPRPLRTWWEQQATDPHLCLAN